MDTAEKLTTCYRKLLGSVPEGIWFAPGRVNLIGEHTDYNDGFVLPFALEQRALVAAGRRDDDLIVMHAMDLSETVELPLSGLNPGGGGCCGHCARRDTGWARSTWCSPRMCLSGRVCPVPQRSSAR